ncbi:hypothetical protein Pmani_001862 [Petrolisthes manimaculis]|uniref:StAR-related lipid transfer protein 3 n=1 Tax=Petrolisthes manimaculis TaxID=1843537 RepID=A0AAE1QLW9_9EUCA|nr:hypothetical protein Pmani_004406 [Petrolisthes manimaculis]KAK4327667.1 hypothetical protein Pmani_001862 [Petrolisthes manimaculis]
MFRSASTLSPIAAGPGSINTVSSDFLLANHLPGMQINGRMSAVRRFFCLFVTFDFLFTSLFWAICILIESGGEYHALVDEIIQYNIKTSFFDIVMVAASRFTILLLFYALLHINHWWMVAITTALSCAFFIVKSLLYKWKSKSSQPFEVTLLLLSFFISWIEAWFVDFRVLPQEGRAMRVLEAATNCDQTESDPLLPRLERVRDYLSHYTETIGDFYSPMESPIGSDDEDEYNIPNAQKKLSPEERELQTTAGEALQKSLEVLSSPGWKLEKESSHGDTIYSKVGPRRTKIYKLHSVVDVDPSILFDELTHRIENMPAWNKALTMAKVVQRVDNNTDVVHQIAAEGPSGMVTARDFVTVRRWKKSEDCWVSASVSVTLKDEPPQKSIVRGENGPGCWVIRAIEGSGKKCSFQWLLDTDLKGWIPQYVLDQTLSHAMTDFMSCLRAHVLTIKAASASAAAAPSSHRRYAR